MRQAVWRRISVRLSLGWLGCVLLSAIFADLVSWPATVAAVLQGGRTTVLFMLTVSLFGVPLGSALGALAGTGARWAEFLLARTVEIVGTWPSVVLVALLELLMPAGSFWQLALLLGLVRAAHVGRLTRGETLRLGACDFAWAARALGMGRARLLGTHLLPHLWGVILAQAALTAAWVVALETGLTLAGLGLSPAHPSWGGLLAKPCAPGWVSPAAVVLAIVLTTVACGVLADAFDDVRHRGPGPAVSPSTPLPAVDGR